MPDNLIVGFQLKAGTVAKGALSSSDTLTNWAAQTDQGVVAQNPPWIDPNMVESKWPQQSYRTQTLDGSSVAHGYYDFDLVFDVWTRDMLDYVNTTFLSGVESAAVTTKVIDLAGDDQFFNAILHKPRLGETLSVIPGGFKVTLRFTHGVDIS